MCSGPVAELSLDVNNGIVMAHMICFPSCLGLPLGGIEAESQLATWWRKASSSLPVSLMFVVLHKHGKMYMSLELGWWNEVNW